MDRILLTFNNLFTFLIFEQEAFLMVVLVLKYKAPEGSTVFKLLTCLKKLVGDLEL